MNATFTLKETVIYQQYFIFNGKYVHTLKPLFHFYIRYVELKYCKFKVKIWNNKMRVSFICLCFCMHVYLHVCVCYICVDMCISCRDACAHWGSTYVGHAYLPREHRILSSVSPVLCTLALETESLSEPGWRSLMWLSWSTWKLQSLHSRVFSTPTI